MAAVSVSDLVEASAYGGGLTGTTVNIVADQIIAIRCP